MASLIFSLSFVWDFSKANTFARLVVDFDKDMRHVHWEFANRLDSNWPAKLEYLDFGLSKYMYFGVFFISRFLWFETFPRRFKFAMHYMSPAKRICVFEHSVMTNFNCACPAIQRGQGSGFLSEGSSWLTACMSEQRRFWRDCADAQARLNLRCSHRL